MEEQYKSRSIDFWNNHADKWEGMVYDKYKKYLRFPTSGQREEIAIREVKSKVNNSASIIDIGCANGELIRSLFSEGYENVTGLDNAKNMISLSRETMLKQNPLADVEKIFIHGDIDTLEVELKYDVVTALGIVEYALDANDFFRQMRKIMNKSGTLILESRNKLFNVYSGNKYTVEADLTSLMKGLESSRNLSPINDDKEVSDLIADTFVKIGNELKDIKIGEDSKGFKQSKDKFPHPLPQYTPMEISEYCNNNNLVLKNIIYYHPHPFPPGFESSYAEIFNRIAVNMQPLGYTPVGASICSSFVAIIEAA
jgi:2-polyprenyl-3-methyl-5-hydroxy-6-metoxy-1,4-benzoquinol methylase